MPEDWTKEVVVPVYKEGVEFSCRIYKGMTLLSHHCHKICERILCNGIKKIDVGKREEQCAFH